MKETLERIVELQQKYSASNTGAMRERGVLIRNVLPKELEAVALEFGYKVEGRDGTGQKSKVPWVRIYDNESSPKARFGWYVVFLFDEEGRSFVISLNQGTTEYVEGEFRTLPLAHLQKRVEWARDHLERSLFENKRLRDEILLGNAQLAKAYAHGHVTGFLYKEQAFNTSAVLEDVRYLLTLLERVYEIESVVGLPFETSPEVKALQSMISESAGKVSSGAPRRASAKERKAIELHAMKRVKTRLESEGWKLKDTSKNRPYDFEGSKQNHTIYIEVKGTTSAGQDIILTKNEVQHHRKYYPNTCLAIVSNIILIKDAEEPSCTGGDIRVRYEWRPREENLTPIAYSYSLKEKESNLPD